MPDDRTLARAAWLAPVALALIVWWPLTRSYFHFDDFLDLYQLRNDDPARYLLRMYGGHLLIARHAITAALDALFGPDPRGFFALVLLTHLVNTGLLYALGLALSGSWRLAVIAAALWGTAPSNEGARGWYAVYGQVLATTCILAVLVGLVRAGDGTRWRPPLVWAVLMLLAGTSFGVGLAAALAMPAAAWLILPPGPARRRPLLALVAAAVLLLVVYAALRALEVPLYGERRVEITFMLAGLTPEYAYNHVRMLGGLVGFGLALLPLGAFSDGGQFPTGGQFASLAAGGLLLGTALVVARGYARRRLLALLLLVGAMYGLIAVARSMFIDFHGLAVLVRSPRFHYATGALLAAALTTALAALAGRWSVPAPAARAAFAAALLAVAWSGLGVERRIDNFDGDRAATLRVLVDIRAAIDAAPPGATVEIANRQFGQVGYVNVGYRDRFPGTAAIFAIFHPENVVDGRRVVFTSDDPLVLKGARGGRRSATLLRELPAPEAAAKDSPS